MNEYYGVATTPTSDFLAHYGIRGMKWGVRKALAASERALRRQYRKAERKLAKLEKRGSSGKKYAKRAAALGAGAAAAGGLAVLGTSGVANVMNKIGSSVRGKRLGGTVRKAGAAVDVAGNAVRNWGNLPRYIQAPNANYKIRSVNNNTVARIGAAAVGAGLAGAAGYNAYRAATAKRNRAKAAKFKREMDKAFKGTKYENGGKPVSKHRKRR